MDLPKRKPMRLQEYDYSLNGTYFITICIEARQNLLWQPAEANSVRTGGEPQLTQVGLVVDSSIRNIPHHYTGITIDKYVIMPNHVHMILLLSGNDGRMVCAPTISRIIKQMKEYVTKQIGFPIWQKSFNDHVIRNEDEYQKIWNYIDTNHLKWQEDCYYIKVNDQSAG